MVMTKQTLEGIKWPQSKSPIKTDNSVTAGVVNNNIVPRKLNTMDLRLHWLMQRSPRSLSLLLGKWEFKLGGL